MFVEGKIENILLIFDFGNIDNLDFRMTDIK
jgi:hypothetical protein